MLFDKKYWKVAQLRRKISHKVNKGNHLQDGNIHSLQHFDLHDAIAVRIANAISLGQTFNLCPAKIPLERRE